jgi:hypothetical protein
MIVTNTAIAFTLLGAGLGVCGWRFLAAFKKTGGDSKIGFILAIFFVTFASTNSILGLGSLFFANNTTGLYSIIVLSNTLLAFLSVLGVYAAYYIFFPGASRFLPMTILSILGVVAVVATIIIHPQPFITEKNSIDWGMTFPLSVAMLYLLFVSIGSAFYIFTRLFLKVKNSEIKFLSLTVAILALAGIVQAFLQYAVFSNDAIDVRTKIQDTTLGLIGIGFIFMLLAIPALKSRLKRNKLP